MSRHVDYISDTTSPFALHLLGDNKMSMMFHAGAIAALRDMNMWRDTRIWSAAGTGNVVLGLLAHVLHEKIGYSSDFTLCMEKQAHEFRDRTALQNAVFQYFTDSGRHSLNESYDRLRRPTAVGSGVLWWRLFLEPLFHFCVRNQESSAFWKFLWRGCWDKGSWRAYVADDLHRLWRNTALTSCVPVGPSDSPVMLFNASHQDQLVCFTNRELMFSAEPPPFQRRVQYETPRGTSADAHTLAEIVATAGFPWTPTLGDDLGDRLWRPHELCVDHQTVPISSSLRLDPLGLRSIRPFYVEQLHSDRNVSHIGDWREVSRRVLLIDGWMNIGQQSEGVRQLYERDLEIVRGAESIDLNEWRVYMRRVASALRPWGIGQEALKDPALQQWFKVMTDNKTRLEGEEEDLLLHAINWGHIVTWHTYRSAQQDYPGLLLDDIGDPYRFVAAYTRQSSYHEAEEEEEDEEDLDLEWAMEAGMAKQDVALATLKTRGPERYQELPEDSDMVLDRKHE